MPDQQRQESYFFSHTEMDDGHENRTTRDMKRRKEEEDKRGWEEWQLSMCVLCVHKMSLKTHYFYK